MQHEGSLQGGMSGFRGRNPAYPLREKKSFNEAFDKYAFPFVELGYRNGLDVQPQIFSYEEWAKQCITPFYKNVEEDGIVLFEN